MDQARVHREPKRLTSWEAHDDPSSVHQKHKSPHQLKLMMDQAHIHQELQVTSVQLEFTYGPSSGPPGNLRDLTS